MEARAAARTAAARHRWPMSAAAITAAHALSAPVGADLGSLASVDATESGGWRATIHSRARFGLAARTPGAGRLLDVALARIRPFRVRACALALAGPRCRKVLATLRAGNILGPGRTLADISYLALGGQVSGALAAHGAGFRANGIGPIALEAV